MAKYKNIKIEQLRDGLGEAADFSEVSLLSTTFQLIEYQIMC